MYIESFPTKITVPLKLNADPELTCLVCKAKRTCELCLEVSYPGCKQWYGLHASCVDSLDKQKGKRRYILRVTDEDAGIMYFHDLDAFTRDCRERGIDAGSDYPLLLERLRNGEEFSDATTEYKWVEVLEQ